MLHPSKFPLEEIEDKWNVKLIMKKKTTSFRLEEMNVVRKQNKF